MDERGGLLNVAISRSIAETGVADRALRRLAELPA
jgi:hypothetical protein